MNQESMNTDQASKVGIIPDVDMDEGRILDPDMAQQVAKATYYDEVELGKIANYHDEKVTRNLRPEAKLLIDQMKSKREQIDKSIDRIVSILTEITTIESNNVIPTDPTLVSEESRSLQKRIASYLSQAETRALNQYFSLAESDLRTANHLLQELTKQLEKDMENKTWREEQRVTAKLIRAGFVPNSST